MKLIGILFASLMIAAMPSCKKELTGEVGVAVTKKDILDVSYSVDAMQKMDVYLPANRTTTSTKTIFFIHGGSWSGGDKTDFNEAITAIRDQLADYAIFNINYRLATATTPHPAQMNDIQTALNFIKTKSSEYIFNPDKIVLIGASAGAHLALLQAYKNNSDARIKAVVDLFGPADLATLYTNHPIPVLSQPVLVNFLGTTPAANATVYQQASPINFVTAQSVPTQIFHGTADPIVPIVQSTTLQAKLQSVNVKVEMTTYIGESHGWVGANLTDTYNKAIAFIKQNVQ